MPTQIALPVGRMGAPEWIVIPAALALEYFIAAEIAPYRMFLNAAMFSLLDSWDQDLFFRQITVFTWVFTFVYLAILSALQTLLIFGAWLLSRARRLSSVLVIGALLLIKTSAFQWSGPDGPPAFSFQFAALTFTAIAVGIAYAWARAVLRNTRVG